MDVYNCHSKRSIDSSPERRLAIPCPVRRLSSRGFSWKALVPLETRKSSPTTLQKILSSIFIFNFTLVTFSLWRLKKQTLKRRSKVSSVNLIAQLATEYCSPWAPPACVIAPRGMPGLHSASWSWLTLWIEVPLIVCCKQMCSMYWQFLSPPLLDV